MIHRQRYLREMLGITVGTAIVANVGEVHGEGFRSI